MQPGKQREEHRWKKVLSSISLLKAPHLLVIKPESRKRGKRRHQMVKEVLYDTTQRMHT